MNQQEIISINDCSHYYKIETTFIHALSEHGLLQIVKYEEEDFIQHDDLSMLERMMHLHYDMDINMEGLLAINHLLDKVNNMKQQMLALRDRLSIYEK